jgi:hypothetical protein
MTVESRDRHLKTLFLPCHHSGVLQKAQQELSSRLAGVDGSAGFDISLIGLSWEGSAGLFPYLLARYPRCSQRAKWIRATQ